MSISFIKSSKHSHNDTKVIMYVRVMVRMIHIMGIFKKLNCLQVTTGLRKKTPQIIMCGGMPVVK